MQLKLIRLNDRYNCEFGKRVEYLEIDITKIPLDLFPIQQNLDLILEYLDLDDGWIVNNEKIEAKIKLYLEKEFYKDYPELYQYLEHTHMGFDDTKPIKKNSKRSVPHTVALEEEY